MVKLVISLPWLVAAWLGLGRAGGGPCVALKGLEGGGLAAH